LIERIAERACDMPWHRIRRALEALQVTKLFNFHHRVTMRNEISNETRKILKTLDIKPPPQVVHLENHSPK
jgi:alpha-D-ribose 1-methylphosphonate 5-triphosphate diphosphatase PhnM